MQIPNDILIRVMVFVLGVCGFMVARHIRKHKVENAPLVCPIGFDCHAVVHSDYSKFFGVPVEFLGMIYYAVISLSYLVLILWGEIMPGSMISLLMVLTLIGFAFSGYLIAVQIFILKKGCSWCIVSSIISACIFFLTILASNISSFS